ncbi:MAG: RNA 2',3'-cyclic phosphodiesterase [Gemmatimonadota bacterium]|nr:RNA 2',3'-cyclic phosphodiesterase [Gemmatimonadota bacterium]
MVSMDTERIRTFIAVELPDTIKTQVEQLEVRLIKARADIKWVKPQNIHITLKFLGDITTERVENAYNGVREALETIRPFQLSLSRVGAFPNLDRARVLWVDVEEGRDELINLQHQIEDILFTRNFVREPRPFSPHLAIGRVRSPKRLRTLTDLVKQTPFQTLDFQVDRVAVIKSDLQSSGSIYTVLEHAPLG